MSTKSSSDILPENRRELKKGATTPSPSEQDENEGGDGGWNPFSTPTYSHYLSAKRSVFGFPHSHRRLLGEIKRCEEDIDELARILDKIDDSDGIANEGLSDDRDTKKNLDRAIVEENIETGYRLLANAEDALLKYNDLISAHHFLSDARERELAGTSFVNEHTHTTDYFPARVRRIRCEAVGLFGEQTVEQYLPRDEVEEGRSSNRKLDGQNTQTVKDVCNLLHLIQDYRLGEYRMIKSLNRQFKYFISSTSIIVSLLALLSLNIGLTFDPSQFDNVVGSLIPRLIHEGITPMNGDVNATTFFIYIVLFGALGASVSGIVTLTREFTGDRVRIRTATFPMAFARVALGAASALAIFMFLQAEIIGFGDITPYLALAVAFAAGFSERFLDRAVDAAIGDGKESSQDISR